MRLNMVTLCGVLATRPQYHEANHTAYITLDLGDVIVTVEYRAEAIDALDHLMAGGPMVPTETELWIAGRLIAVGPVANHLRVEAHEITRAEA